MTDTNRTRSPAPPLPVPQAPSGTPGRVVGALVALAPFTAALVAFKGILDYLLPEDWFSVSFVRVLFAGVCALCVGLVLRLLGERYRPTPTDPPVPGPPVSSTAPAVRRIIDDSERGVLAEFREVHHGGTDLAGWSQYLDDHGVPPTAVGTSYGLRVVTSFDIRDPRISRHRVVESLLALQKPGGGWAASTQRDRGRPEITAWVLAAMYRAGLDDTTRQQLVRLLEGMLDVADDPIGMNRTTVMTVVISTLAEVAPRSPALPLLARRLLDGARRDDSSETLTYWGENLVHSTRSAAHTARAAIALHRAAGVLPDGGIYERASRSGINWLCNTDLSLQTTDEQLRRPVDDGSVDALMIGHFTSAWVARALMLPGAPDCEDPLRHAVAETLKRHTDGAWRWHDDTRPIWMTYQGAMVLRDYALRNTRCL